MQKATFYITNKTTRTMESMKLGTELIAEERSRLTELNEPHKNDELALVASFYAMTEQQRLEELSTDTNPDTPPSAFPWDEKKWKPSPNNRIKELQKAGALIAAEIDRLQNLKK